MSSSKGGGGGGGGGVGPSRRTWDVNEYAAKAAERDRQEASHHQARGRGGRYREELAKPTQTLQARAAPLQLDKNVGKSIMVDATARPGFFCQLCNKTLKDSVAYLDHVNGRLHLLRLGQSTHVHRATLQQVRDKIASLRANLNSDGSRKSAAQSYDFDARIAQIAQQEALQRQQRRRRRKEQRNLHAKRDTPSDPHTHTPSDPHTHKQTQSNADADADMMASMGFGGFGSTKKR